MIYLNIKELLKKKGKSKYWLIKNMEMEYFVLCYAQNKSRRDMLNLNNN